MFNQYKSASLFAIPLAVSLALIPPASAGPVSLSTHELDTITAGTAVVASATATGVGETTETLASTSTFAALLAAWGTASGSAQGEKSAFSGSTVLLTADETATLIAALASVSSGSAQTMTQARWKLNHNFLTLKVKAKAMATGQDAATAIVFEVELPAGGVVRFTTRTTQKTNLSKEMLRFSIRIPVSALPTGKG